MIFLDCSKARHLSNIRKNYSSIITLHQLNFISTTKWKYTCKKIIKNIIIILGYNDFIVLVALFLQKTNIILSYPLTEQNKMSKFRGPGKKVGGEYFQS